MIKKAPKWFVQAMAELEKLTEKINKTYSKIWVKLSLENQEFVDQKLKYNPKNKTIEV
jgi:hypothetical protein